MPLSKSYVIWGVDPGLRGAICAARFRDGKPISMLFFSPKVEYARSKISGRRHGHVKVREMLANCLRLAKKMPPNKVVFEKVGAFPKQGVNSVFSFGRVVGIFESVLAICVDDTPIEMPRPNDWKNKLGLILSDSQKNERKRFSIYVANEYLKRNPLIGVPYFRSMDDGKAEALLLACSADPIATEEIRAITQESSSF